MSRTRGFSADAGPQTLRRPQRFLLSYGTMQFPVIYLLLEHVGLFAQHSSACPPQHMKASATAVLDGGKWVPDGKVFCVYVCVCVSCHIRERFLTVQVTWVTSPRVMWGRRLQDGGECVGEAYCMWTHVCCSWRALDMCVFSLEHTQETVENHAEPKDSTSNNFTTLQSTFCKHCWAYVLRHASAVQLEGYWLHSCNQRPSCC